MKDLQVIEVLEQQTGRKLERLKLDSLVSLSNGYSIGETGNINGLSLYRLKLSDYSLLQKLPHLEYIALRSIQLTDITPLMRLTKLVQIRLNDNRLKDITPLKGLTNLVYLDLYGNQLTDLTPLKGLTNLTYLDASRNKLTDLTPFKGLTNLTQLDLYWNQLTDLTPLKGLINLTHLDLRSNELTDLTPLKGLTKLKLLLLEKNIIRQLPESIFDLGMTIHVGSYYDGYPGLWLKDNPLGTPPIEIIKQGNNAVKTWFKAQQAGKKRALNEVKVLLVGEGAAGKTSLMNRLMHDQFNPDESQTHGININRWNVRANHTDIKVRMWDFGGQEIMHATHQFFLSKRSLYILVLDGRRDDDKTEYWLKHIESFGGGSPVLVVINKMDENPGFDVNRPFLLDKYPNIKGFFEVSCKTGTGVKEFKGTLMKELAGLEMLRTIWAGSWFNVKTHLEVMTGTEHYIGFQRYNAICIEQKISDPYSRQVLLDYLNDLGVVLNFRDFALSDTHVLEPRWVTQAVYRIINAKNVVDCKGQLHMEHLRKILAKTGDDDYEYPEEKYRYIIGLMKKFELCYGIGDKGSVLVPDLLPVRQPDFTFPYDDCLGFIIEYQFLPRSIMPRFIVNIHKDIETQDLQWRTGAVLYEPGFETRAVVKADNEAKRIYIHVTGRRRRDYFAVLLATLRRIHQSFEKLETTELVPMPDDPKVTASYKQLIRFEERGIDTYLPGESDKEYKVKDLLGSFESKNATEDEILAILRKLTDEKDTEETTFKKVNNALIMKPTLFGFGLDINALLDKLKKKK